MPVDSRWKEAFQEAYESLGGMGERVLGFAELYLDENQFGPDFDSKYNADEWNFPMVNCFLLFPLLFITLPSFSFPLSHNN